MNYIEILGEIRSGYNIFDERERPYYEALTKAISILKEHGAEMDATEFEHMVSEQPTVDAVPVVHGHWEIVPNDENRDDYYKMRCSVCGGTLWSIQPEELYCCKCGAKMDATDINLDDGSTTEDVSVVQRKDRDDE